MVVALAEAQHGVLAGYQALALGVTRAELRGLGWLRPIHRDVYAVRGRPLGDQGRWMAAVLAVGEDTHLFGRSACAALGMAEDDPRHVHVACPRGVPPREGIQPHRLMLEPVETGSIWDIRCCEPNRAIADFAATATRRELERALDQAAYDGTLSLDALDTYAASSRRGSRALMEVLGEHKPGTTITRSEMEELFLALCDRFGLPRPEMNVRHVLPNGRHIRIDALYAQAALAIELDGRGGHAHVKAFRKDRERDRGLLLQGLRPIRYTYADLTRNAAQTASEVATLIEIEVVVPQTP